MSALESDVRFYLSQLFHISKMGFSTTQFCQVRPRGYKTFSVLNSAEHEILNAHKYKNIKNFSVF